MATKMWMRRGVEMGNRYTPYEGQPTKYFGDWLEGDVIYERIGTLKKRAKIEKVTEEFEVGKTYKSSLNNDWLCYATTPLGFIFKSGSVIAEVGSQGFGINNGLIMKSLPVIEKVVGEEWYIDRTDV